MEKASLGSEEKGNGAPGEAQPLEPKAEVRQKANTQPDIETTGAPMVGKQNPSAMEARVSEALLRINNAEKGWHGVAMGNRLSSRLPFWEKLARADTVRILTAGVNSGDPLPFQMSMKAVQKRGVELELALKILEGYSESGAVIKVKKKLPRNSAFRPMVGRFETGGIYFKAQVHYRLQGVKQLFRPSKVSFGSHRKHFFLI